MAAQDRINQLQAYIDFYNKQKMGVNRAVAPQISQTWSDGDALSRYTSDFTAFDNKQATEWAQKQAELDDVSQQKLAQNRSIDPETAQQMPDFYGKQNNAFTIPAYQAPQYRQSSPMPQYQGGNGIQNMLAELLRSRQPQNTFRQG